MAAPLSVDLCCKFPTCRRLLSPLALSQTFIKFKSPDFYNNEGQKLQSRSFANKIMVSAGTPPVGPFNAGKLQLNFTSTFSFPSPVVGGSQYDKPCFWVPSRNYGRKVTPRPPKITFFGYSGDLRKIPELDQNLILYKYRDVQDQLEGNEVVKKLATLEFASAIEISNHRKQLIKDRMVELFGPDCELEQRIAIQTLHIRVNIPRCIKYRSDKFNKTKLVRTIASRRNLLTELRSLDHERFEWLLKELKIRYVIPKDREEKKTWKEENRIAVEEEVREKKRKKLEELKAKFDSEKKIFYEHKAKVMSKIEEDLNKFGLDWDHLNNLIKAEKEALEQQQREQELEKLRASVRQPKEVTKNGKRA